MEKEKCLEYEGQGYWTQILAAPSMKDKRLMHTEAQGTKYALTFILWLEIWPSGNWQEGLRKYLYVCIIWIYRGQPEVITTSSITLSHRYMHVCVHVPVHSLVWTEGRVRSTGRDEDISRLGYCNERELLENR